MTPHEWQTAQHVCTPLELQALDWWRRGAGYKRIALILGISRSAARDRIDRATTKTARHLNNTTPNDR